ncbi:hypothetical protein [Enterobacter mori]
MTESINVSCLNKYFTSQAEKNIRCALRRNELLHRQSILFKLLNNAVGRYCSLGFSIVFTGERELMCFSGSGKPDTELFCFQLPVFSVVYRVSGFVRAPEQQISSAQSVILAEEVVRFRFTPEVSESGGVSYRFEEFIPGVSWTATGDLSWQGRNMLETEEHWHFNVSRSDGLKSRPLDTECVEAWLARMFVRNAAVQK